MSEGQLYSRCSACEFIGLGRLTWEYVGFLDLFVNVETNSQLVKIVRAHHLKNPIDYAYCHGQHYLYTDI